MLPQKPKVFICGNYTECDWYYKTTASERRATKFLGLTTDKPLAEFLEQFSSAGASLSRNSLTRNLNYSKPLGHPVRESFVMTMSDSSVTRWLERVETGDDVAAAKLWNAYFDRLVHLAHGRLQAKFAKVNDAEDIALSAFHSFCRGVENKKVPRVVGSRWALATAGQYYDSQTPSCRPRPKADQTRRSVSRTAWSG